MCADVEPLGVVSSDVLHGFGAESGRGLSVDDGDVGSEQGVPDVVPLGARGGGHEFSDGALSTGGRDRSAGDAMLLEVAVD